MKIISLQRTGFEVKNITWPTATTINDIHLDYWRAAKKGYSLESCEVLFQIVRRRRSNLKKSFQRLSTRRTLTDILVGTCMWKKLDGSNESLMSLLCHIQSFGNASSTSWLFSTDVTSGRADPSNHDTNARHSLTCDISFIDLLQSF